LCDCGKSYTRPDNLLRHKQQKNCSSHKKHGDELNDAPGHDKSGQGRHRQQQSRSLSDRFNSSSRHPVREQSTTSDNYSQSGKTRSMRNRTSRPGFEGNSWVCQQFRYELSSPQGHKCNVEFTTESALFEHRREQHSHYDCIKCLNGFASEVEWRAHRKDFSQHCYECSTCVRDKEMKKRMNHNCDPNRKGPRFIEEAWQHLYKRYYVNDPVEHNPCK
jgi:hypothetical protein